MVGGLHPPSFFVEGSLGDSNKNRLRCLTLRGRLKTKFRYNFQQWMSRLPQR